MFRRNLFKHFLPVALSVAMTVQSVPVTSYAAETETIETETAVAEESEEASDEQVGNDGEEAKPEETKGEEENKTSEEVTTEEVKTEETKTEETKETSEEVKTEETKTEETKAEETNKTSEEVTPEEENKASEETKSEEEKIEAQAEEEIENNKAEELPKSEIVFNFEYLDNYDLVEEDDEGNNILAPAELEFSRTDKSFKAVYFASNAAAQKVEKTVKDRTSIKIDTATDVDEERWDRDVKYQWQSKNDKGEWADCDVPEVTGEYRIKVSFAEQAGLCKAAEDAFVYFSIEKKEITINPWSTWFDAGKEVSEVIAKITEEYTVDIPDKDVGVIKEKTTIKIKEAASGKELAATDKLQDKVSYVVEFNVVLTDDFAKNYKLSEDPAKYTFNITTDAKQATVTVETKDGVTLGKKWDGKAITIDDIAKNITSFKVEADEEDNEVDKVLTTDIKDANVTLTWKNGEDVEIVAPSDAGQYTLEIGYEADNYGKADPVELRVVIDPVDIIVVPELSDADKKVADGDKVDDILKKVTYKVYEVVDGKKSETAMSVDEYFWGEYENEDGYPSEQYYQPRAIVQVGTKNGDNIDWTSLADGDKISSDETKQYRVVFDGKLVVYDKDGIATDDDGNPIINKTDKVQLNYRADITDAVKDANNVVLTVAAATEVTIDVSDILKDKKGDSYDNAIISTYNGEGIYASKADYKKAKLVDKEGKAVASDKEKDFTYQWQRIKEYDADNKEVTPDIVWEDLSDVEVKSAPCNAGNYRLEITYTHTDDKGTVDNTYRAKEKAYVYYTILPQDAIVEVTGAPAAYADGVTTIGEYYTQARLDNNIGIKLYAYDKATKTAGSEIALDVEEQADLRDWLTVWVKVEEEGEHKGEFVQCNARDKFEAGRDYVLTVSREAYEQTGGQTINDISKDIFNYNLGRDLDKHGIQQSNNMLWRNADKGAKIEVKASQGVEVSIDIDTTQIKNRSQEYNGKAFDLSEIKSLVRITNKKTGEDLTAALKDKLTYQFENTDDTIKVYDRYDDSNAYRVADKEIVKDGDVIHGGTYKLVAKMDATDVYAAATTTIKDANNSNTEFTITKKELVVTPKVKDEVKAGLPTGYVNWTSTGSNKYTDDIIADIPDTPDGYIGDDADGVLWYDLYIYNDSVGNSRDNVLKSGKTYYAEYTYVGLKHTATTGDYYHYDASKPITYFDRDYSPRSERVAFTPVRAEASVAGVTVDTNYNTIEAIDNISGSAKDGYVHTITAKQAIPYDKGERTLDNGKKVVKGNEFTINITAPKEFEGIIPTDAVYDKAIKAAGGVDVNTVTVTDENDDEYQYIKVTFNAEAKDVKEFDIVWKPGYKETFKVDFTNAKLEANFTQAVAPKSLAFNAVNKNMAVGGTQQLDVKITKKQMSDVILLRYASSDESVLKVSDSGYVTALKNGTATISVFPCYQDKEGKIVKIEGAKAATVQIKVAEVAKPKISKVSVRGTQADVLYAEPANGYRREIYVLEGKNLKEAAFESAISAVKNGDYSDFAYVNLDAYEDFNSKTVTTTVNRLESNTEYTVYVRNVSGLRTLENGATVAISAAGAVKSFKTTTQENVGLRTYFDIDNTKVDCDDTDDRCDARHDKYSHAYTINLADKKAKLSVDAAYKQNLSYSDEGDFIWRALPLSKEDQQKYLSPKLEYYVFNIDYVYPLYDDFIDDLKAGRISQSKLATVDKNGNVTVKGAGKVYVYAVDRVAGKCSTVELNIVAEPDSVKGKNAALTVGQSIELSSLLTYKEGKNVIEGYQNTDWVDLSIDQQSNEYFKIEKDDLRWDGEKYTTDYKITPIKAGGKLVINVTDKTVAKNGGAPTKVTITSKDIAAVQGLKVANVTDTDFGIFFTDKADSGVAGYKVEVKDERGNILYSEIKSRPSISYYSNKPVREVNGKKYTDKQWFEMDASNTLSSGYQDVKANKNTYYYHISDTSINLLSKYTVSVTALYGDDNGYVESKTVSKAVKTTNIPANRYDNLLPGQTGGAYIYINTKYKDASSNSYRLNDINALVSGNKYTLTYSTGNTANVRKTDTLTWKSTDTKVATVKANAGSYSATLKAVKPGKTTIEVTSKITKKVIARYDVYVAASGDAHQYFGDNEPYNWSEFAQLFSLNDAINDGSIIEVIAGAPKRVKIDAMTRQWFMFEAPEYADYTFSAGFNAVCADKKTAFTSGDHLDKGDVIYLSYDNNNANDITVLLTISASNLKQEVKVGENAVIAGKNYIFVAPTANCYTFKWLDKNGEELSSSVKTLSVNGKFSLTAPANAVKLVISIPATEEIVKAGEEKTIKFEKLDGVWNTYKFVAPEDGIYKFAKPTTSETGAAVDMQLLDSLDEIAVGTGESVKTDSLVNNGITVATESVEELRKGEVKYIAIKATSMPTDATKKSFECKLSIAQATAVEIGKEATVTVKKGTANEYASIVIPESGDYKITVTASADKNGIDDVTVDDVALRYFGTDAKTRTIELEECTKNEIVKIAFASIAANDVTYTIKAEKLIKDKIKVGDTDVAVAEKARKIVELPITETGIYTITVKGSENIFTSVYGVDDNGWYDYDVDPVYLEAGTNAKIAIYHEKTETVKVTVKKETINPLASGDVTLSKDGETKYFKFTADKEGVYTISIPTEVGKTVAYKADKLEDILSNTLTSWNGVTEYMPAGKTIYVKMTSDSGLSADATVKVTVSGGVADVATLDKEISVEKNSTKVVSFVAPKKARYEVTGMAIKYGYGLDYVEWDLDEINRANTSNTVVLEAGQKIYFKAVNDDTENSKSFKISEVTTKKADGKDTVSLKNGEGAWFEITAGTSAYYDIIATAELAEATTSATMKYYVVGDLTNGTNYWNQTGKREFQYIAPNTKAYVYVEANVSNDQAATVKVEAKAAGSDELTKAEGYELTAYKYYAFSTTVTEDGYYRISADNDNFSINSPKVGVKNVEYSNRTVKLSKGDKLTVKIYAYNTATYKFKLDKLTVLTDKEQDIAVKKGEKGYAVVVGKDKGKYISTWVNGDTIFTKDANISTVGGWAVVSSERNNGEADVTYKVSVKPLTYESIKVGETVTVKQADFKKGTQYYSVDVEAGKTYIVKTTNASKGVSVDVTYTNNNNIEYVIGDLNGKLKINFTPDTAVTDKDATLTVTEAKAVELKDGQYTIDITKVEPNEPVYLEYTVPEDGEYTASFAADKDETGTYSASYDVVKKVGGSTTTAKYYKDNKVLYRVYYNSTNLTKNLTFKVTKTPTQAITKVGEEVKVSAPKGDIKLTYVAAVGETPTIALSGDAVPGVTLNTTPVTEVVNVGATLATGAVITQESTNGKKYTWTLTNTNTDAKEVKVKITVDKTDVSLKLGSNDVTFDTTKDPKETKKVVAFTAEKAGEYKLTYADKDQQIGNNFKLVKGQKYVTTVGSDPDVEDGKKIVVKVTLVQEATVLELGKQFRGTGVSTLYVFTATTGGVYAVVDEEGKAIDGSSKTLAAGESYMFTGEIATSRLVSLERTDNK